MPNCDISETHGACSVHAEIPDMRKKDGVLNVLLPKSTTGTAAPKDIKIG